jgi:ADP-heptose:LPS heptosyltransferase
MKKLCLLKFSALGDLAQIEPFLPSFAKEYEITLFTSPLGYEYYKASPYIADFIVLKSKKIHHLLATIPKFWNQFDYFVDMQGNDRSKFLSYFAKAKRISNYTKGFKIATLPDTLKPYLSENSVYHVDVYSILAQLPISFEFLPFQAKAKTYIVLNCGSSPKWISKRLPIHKWQEIANVLYEKFQLPFILTGEKAEYAYITEIANTITHPNKVLAGKTTICELKEMLANAFLTVSTDSASLHISSVQKTPSIGIFGPTSWIYAKPFGPWSKAIYDEKFYKEGIPPAKNRQEIDAYFEYIDISPVLDQLEPYLH